MKPLTMEADIDHGRIIPKEPEKLPATGKALLIVLEPEPKRKPDWKIIEKSLAALRPRFDGLDGVAYEKKVREEWDERERKQWENWKQR